MSLFHRPACLSHLHREELATGLIRVGCHYAPERLCDDSFDQAAIPLPSSLTTAVAKRRSEYLAGRWCAREALAMLGVPGLPALGRDRSPQWPGGTLGSITHSQGIAEVMVADAHHWLAVGLDTERWLSAEIASCAPVPGITDP